MKTEPDTADRVEPAPNKRATFYQADTYRPEDSVGWMLQRIVSGMGLEIERRLSDDGPTSPQWMPLFKLHLGEASTVAELARSCRLDAGAMTRLLDRLEAKGLCRRCRSTTDRRVVNVELTDEGRRCAQEIPAVICLVQNEHLSGFSEGEWQQLKDFLRRIMNNAQAIQSRESNDENA